MSPPRPRRAPPQVPYRTSGSVSHTYARWTVKARWWIVAGWVLGLGLLVVVAGRVGPSNEGLADIIPLDSPAARAELRSIAEFGFPLSSRTVVVQRDPAGLSPYTQAAAVLDAVAVNQHPQRAPLLGALPLTNAPGLTGATGETDTTVLTYLFMNPDSSFVRQQRAARSYVAEHLNRADDHVIGVAGSVPARAEQARLLNRNLPRLELFTVIAITALVGLNFRSIVPPLLALTASGVAFAATVQLTHILGVLLGFAAPAELEPLLVALLLGVVTDYTIFYLTPLRSPGVSDDAHRDRATRAVGSFTPIVLVAGLTVAAGTASLLAAGSEFFKGLGPALASAVLVGLAVSVTLIPALIAILGELLFWPHRLGPSVAAWIKTIRPRLGPPAPTQPPPPRRHRLHLINRLTDKRVAAGVLLGCLAILTAASLPLRHIDLAVAFTTSLPADNPVSRANAASSAGFAPGINSPTTLLIEGPGLTGRLAQLANLQHQIEAQPGVAFVLGPAQNFTQREIGIVLAKSGSAARMLVVLDHDPLGAAAIDELTALRTRLPDLAHQAGLDDAQISVAGDTALAQGIVGTTGRDLLRIALVAGIVNLLLLMIFLRALVAPLFLLASSGLALTAALGLTTGLYLNLRHHDGLTFFVPFAAAVLLVAFGSDYNIFGVGHIWEEAGRRPLRHAIIKAVPESTRAIAAAGLTLAASFGMLAVIPLSPFRELGFAVAAGIMIDVIIVRSLMVPALLTLVGPTSGWPGPHLRPPPLPPRD